jgi:ADP-ribose pyrophosphatase YjhB (NUDIX family)
MSRTRIRTAGILIKDNKILLIHRTREGKEFWVFPGGGVEKNEKVEDATVREIEEEASIKSKVVKLLYTHNRSDINHEHFFYLCKHISGTPKLGNFNEIQTMKSENQTYKPVWVNIKELPKLLLYPLEIRDWIIEDYKDNFKDAPKTATLKTIDLRQQI